MNYRQILTKEGETLESGEIFEQLVKIAASNHIKILFCDLQVSDGHIKGRRIAIRYGMNMDSINYILAHEIAHFYLHYDKADIINSPEYMWCYEEQADRAAKLLLDGICQCTNLTFDFESGRLEQKLREGYNNV